MSITVKQADANDKAALFDFIKIAYKNSYKFKIPFRWEWEFENNPYYKKEGYPVFIAQDNEKIIGQTCAMHVPLQIGDRSFSAAWSVDTIVLPEYRGKGAGKILQNRNAAEHKIFMSLSMSDINRKIKEKFGSIPLSEVWQLNKKSFLTGGFLKQYFLDKTRNYSLLNTIARLICFTKMNYLISFGWFLFVFPVLRIRQLFWKYNPENIHETTDIVELDEFWDKIKKNYSFIIKRESSYLKWKYFDQPDLKYKIFCYKEKEMIRGFIVLRCGHPAELKNGIIADILVDDDHVFKELILFALKYFQKQKVGMIQIVSSVNDHVSQLMKLGFVKEKHIFPMFYSTDNKLLDEVKTGNYNCYFTKGDHDFDQIIPV